VPKTILVTGAAGFIGLHVALALVKRGDEVVGVDNLNDYYDVNLKRARLEELKPYANFRFIKLDIADRDGMERLFAKQCFTCVVHLAAQAGVRYSLKNPHAYVQSNLVGFLNVLEGCRTLRIEHLVFASSSSVYGANTKLPFSVNDNVDHPISLYAATKKANELMAHTYSYLYQIPATGLRFFTVYGPWGRPDMAMFLFTRAILEGQPIDVYNYGDMQRDFTYIDDVVEAVIRVIDKPPDSEPRKLREQPDGAAGAAPYKIYNIGNHQPVKLSEFIATLENVIEKKAVRNMLPMQAGDVPATYADVDDLREAVGFAPTTPLASGVERFVKWYRGYHSLA
jgi:UDP-glucuronate 4-epimerase